MISNIQKLHKTTSKYDVIYKGNIIKLKLDPCHCGVHAKWTVETKMKNIVPSHIKELMPPNELDKTVEDTLAEWHYHPTLFQKYILRHTLESELRKWVHFHHEKFLNLRNSEINLDGLMERL